MSYLLVQQNSQRTMPSIKQSPITIASSGLNGTSKNRQMHFDRFEDLELQMASQNLEIAMHQWQLCQKVCHWVSNVFGSNMFSWQICLLGNAMCLKQSAGIWNDQQICCVRSKIQPRCRWGKSGSWRAAKLCFSFASFVCLQSVPRCTKMYQDVPSRFPQSITLNLLDRARWYHLCPQDTWEKLDAVQLHSVWFGIETRANASQIFSAFSFDTLSLSHLADLQKQPGRSRCIVP